MVNKRKTGRGNLYLPENRYSKIEMWRSLVTYNGMPHIMCERIFRFEF